MSLRFDLLCVTLSVKGSIFVIQTFVGHQVGNIHILYNTKIGEPSPPGCKILLNSTASPPRKHITIV